MGPLLTLIVLWIVLAAVWIGLGLAARRLLSPRRDTAPDLYGTLWAGFGLGLALLMVWHFFAPITLASVVVLGTIAAVGWVDAAARGNLHALLLSHGRTITLLIAIPLTYLLAQAAIAGNHHYDDGLYTIQELRWLREYPALRGLGNVNQRFGFNSAYTLYAAALDAVPALPNPRHILTGGMVWAFMLYALRSWEVVIVAHVRKPGRALRWSDYMLVMASPAVLAMSSGLGIAHLKNDLPILLLALVLAAQTLDVLQVPPATPDQSRWLAAQAALVAMGGVLIKLNMAVTAAGLLVAIAWALYRAHGWRPLLRPMLYLITISGLWLYRGVLLTGYLLFPLARFPVAVSWRMPADIVTREADYVQSWARQPQATPEEVLGNWDWVPRWWAFITNDHPTHHVGFVAALGLMLAALVLGMMLAARRRLSDWRAALVPLMGGVGVAFWWWSAPDLRFGLGPIWVLAAGSWAALVALHPDNRLIPRAILAASLGLAIYALAVFDYPARPGGAGFPADDPYLVYQLTNAYGHTVHLPTVGDQCWDGPLPCSPDVRQAWHLDYRDGRSPNHGFVYNPRTDVSDRAVGFNTYPAPPFYLQHLYPDGTIIEATAYAAAIENGVVPQNGLFLGYGWYPLEVYGDVRQQWAMAEAEIVVTGAYPAGNRRLELRASVGPSIPAGVLTLEVLDESRAVVATANVVGEQTIVLELALRAGGLQTFYLHVPTEGVPLADGRVLKWRALSLRWLQDD